LLFDDMADLRDFQIPYAKSRRQFGIAGNRVGLIDTIKMASPTMLMGTSTVHGAFTREINEAMAASTERPLILPLSNPTSRMEAKPEDVLAWSHGSALVATGCSIAPVEYDGTSYAIGQANNLLVFPGIGLGVIVAGAWRITKGMLDAAAKALAREADPTTSGAGLCQTWKTCGPYRRWSPRRSMPRPSRTVWLPKTSTTLPKSSSTPCGCPNTIKDSK
jgi:malate dehydrogenase (oxaloacetate-decarboxylating)